jgi:hypothetical protein
VSPGRGEDAVLSTWLGVEREDAVLSTWLGVEERMLYSLPG